MRDMVAFAFVLTLAVGGALTLGGQEAGSRQVACTSTSEGSWFYTEYCRPALAAVDKVAEPEGLRIATRLTH